MARQNKEEIALHLLTSSSLKEAADRSGISITSLRRLRRQEDFIQIVKDTKNKMFNEAMQTAAACAVEAVHILRDIAQDKAATDSSRVSAARTLLEFGQNAMDTELILHRIQMLEERMVTDEQIQ